MFIIAILFLIFQNYSYAIKYGFIPIKHEIVKREYGSSASIMPIKCHTRINNKFEIVTGAVYKMVEPPKLDYYTPNINMTIRLQDHELQKFSIEVHTNYDYDDDYHCCIYDLAKILNYNINVVSHILTDKTIFGMVNYDAYTYNNIIKIAHQKCMFVQFYNGTHIGIRYMPWHSFRDNPIDFVDHEC
jgi:hypothetical protein